MPEHTTISGQFYIYIGAEFNSQWPVTESERIQIITTRQNKQVKKTIKINQFGLLTLKYVFLKMYVILHIAFAVETRLASS